VRSDISIRVWYIIQLRIEDIAVAAKKRRVLHYYESTVNLLLLLRQNDAAGSRMECSSCITQVAAKVKAGTAEG
jgi:hypothetical protein